MNGTCNYILTRMKLEGADFAAVLAEAKGWVMPRRRRTWILTATTRQHKTGILASLAHGFWVNPKKIHVEGIRHVRQWTSNLPANLATQSSYLAS